MKKLKFLWIILFLVLLTVLGYVLNNARNYDLTLKEAENINQKCNLGLEYMSFSRLSEERAKQYTIDDPEMAITDDDKVKGYYFNYPENSADRRLTQIYIKGSSYDFYGIQVGDDISKVKTIMAELGYKQKKNIYYPNTATERYVKYHICIEFKTDEKSTEIICISVTPSYPSLTGVIDNLLGKVY
jgi:hypothetical protein